MKIVYQKLNKDFDQEDIPVSYVSIWFIIIILDLNG